MRVTRVSRFVLSASALAGFALAAQPAAASEKVAVNPSHVALKVDGRGHAVVYYTQRGRRYHPVLWGAINARPPSRSVPQVRFKADYSGGPMRLGYPLWRTIKNRCRPYDGPRLAWFVAGCKAPDGSYWALQSFKRLLPNYGVTAWKSFQRARELHLSHWRGELPRLEVYADWIYNNRYRELFGRLTYQGRPVYGFTATSTGVPLDRYGRLIFVDTYASAYGRGWKRENSFLARKPTGHYCYGFYPHTLPSNYPRAGTRRPAGVGTRYRLTAGGPGVTPFTARIVADIGPHTGSPEDRDRETSMNALKRQLAPSDSRCWTE